MKESEHNGYKNKKKHCRFKCCFFVCITGYIRWHKYSARAVDTER